MKLKFSQLAKAVLCTAAMAVSALGSMTISASAADNINVDIVCKNDTTTVSNAEWSIYKVGERKEADFVLTGEFSDYPIVCLILLTLQKCRLSLIRSTTTQKPMA